MKKISLVLLIIMCLFLSGCGEEKKDADLRPSIVLDDKNNGLTTTWKYDEGEKYSYKDADNQGKYKEIIVRNEDLNMRVSFYYFETTNEAYNSGKENRRERPGFMEYTWNGYNGYTYNGDEEKMSFQILLGTNEELNRTIAIAGQVDYIFLNKGSVIDSFNSESFQKLMNTMEFQER